MKKHKQKGWLEKFSLRFWRQLPLNAKRIEILIIIVSVLAVLVAILVEIFFNAEAVTKRSLENMAKDYYENYYYEKFLDVVENPEATLEKYAVSGFPAISVKQLLLFDNRRNGSQTALMEENCNTEMTTIKIFPEEPFGKKNYRVEYNYSCNF